MKLTELLAFYDQDQRRDAEWPGTIREVTPRLVRHRRIGRPFVMIGYTHFQGLTEQEIQATIQAELDRAQEGGYPLEWKTFTHDEPADLHLHLGRVGLTVEAPEAIMVLDLESAPAPLLAPIRADVRRLTDPAELRLVSAVEEAVWETDFGWLQAELAEEWRLNPEGLSLYVAWADAQPVSAAWVRFLPGSPFGSLWGGSTLAAYRGQGFYTALLAVRVQEALARGLRFLTVDASAMSRPILARMGFQHLTTSYPCQWHHPA